VPAGDDDLKALRLGELYYVIGLVTSMYPDLLVDLKAAYQHGPIDYDRYMLALTRIVEPLLEARESGFIELGWQDLFEEEQRQGAVSRASLRRYRLRDFLAAGVAREMILLDRDSDEDRAYSVGQSSRTSADPDWHSQLLKQSREADTETQRIAWKRAWNDYVIALNNLGIKEARSAARGF
jgi:hypothetical protein